MAPHLSKETTLARIATCQFPGCRKEFTAQRSDTKYCSDKCRYRADSRRSSRRRIPNDLRFSILRRDNFRCRYCGATPERRELRVDHVVPVDAGGTDRRENLVTACNECNAGKSDLVIDPSEVPVGQTAGQ